jgi:hypothetical protein
MASRLASSYLSSLLGILGFALCVQGLGPWGLKSGSNEAQCGGSFLFSLRKFFGPKPEASAVAGGSSLAQPPPRPPFRFCCLLHRAFAVC